MSKIEKFEIVQENEIFTDEEIKNMCFTETKIYSVIFSHDKLSLFAKLGLIKNKVWCNSCNIYKSLTKDTRRPDGYLWKCKNCNNVCSIRDKSIFESIRKDIQ